MTNMYELYKKHYENNGEAVDASRLLGILLTENWDKLNKSCFEGYTIRDHDHWAVEFYKDNLDVITLFLNRMASDFGSLLLEWDDSVDTFRKCPDEDWYEKIICKCLLSNYTYLVERYALEKAENRKPFTMKDFYEKIEKEDRKMNLPSDNFLTDEEKMLFREGKNVYPYKNREAEKQYCLK